VQGSKWDENTHISGLSRDSTAARLENEPKIDLDCTFNVNSGNKNNITPDKNTLHTHAGMEKNQPRHKNDQSDTGSTSNLPGYPPGRTHGESTENKEIEDPSPAGTSSTPQITEEKCAGVEKNPFRHNPGIILENAVDSFEWFSELILINI
jgi:hypothetical protein